MLSEKWSSQCWGWFTGFLKAEQANVIKQGKLQCGHKPPHVKIWFYWNIISSLSPFPFLPLTPPRYLPSTRSHASNSQVDRLFFFDYNCYTHTHTPYHTHNLQSLCLLVLWIWLQADHSGLENHKGTYSWKGLILLLHSVISCLKTFVYGWDPMGLSPLYVCPLNTLSGKCLVKPSSDFRLDCWYFYYKRLR